MGRMGGAAGATAAEVWALAVRRLSNLSDARAALIDNTDFSSSNLLKRVAGTPIYGSINPAGYVDDVVEDGASVYAVEEEEAGEPYHSLATTDAVTDSDCGAIRLVTPTCPLAYSDLLTLEGACTVFSFLRAKLGQTTDCRLFIGYGDVFSAEEFNAPTAVVFYDSAVGGNWQSRTWMGAEEQQDTGVAADTDWHSFLIERTLTYTKFYIDDVLVTTHTTQIPDGGLGNFTTKVVFILRTLADVEKTAMCSAGEVWIE